MSRNAAVVEPPIMARIYSRNFQYTPAAATDVRKTWEKHGWVRPDPNRHDAARLRLNRFW